MLLTVVLEKTNTGYSAYVKEIDGIIATGDSLEEAKREITEAIEFHKEGYMLENMELPEALKGDYSLFFELDVTSFFEWISGKLSQTGLANIAGLNVQLVNQYASGLKKPSAKQKQKITNHLHEFAKELQMISL
jgi:predicted RNase H-like HicB family nuclease